MRRERENGEDPAVSFPSSPFLLTACGGGCFRRGLIEGVEGTHVCAQYSHGEFSECPAEEPVYPG